MKSSAARFYAGDVLYGRLRPYLNKVAKPAFEGLASAEFIVFPPTGALDPSFLLCRISARDFVSFAGHLDEGDRPRVNFDQIGDFPVLLPPMNEQRRIVAKIEELFSELDKAVECLKTAREQLKVYRQALLKHAFEGKLTEQWRRENADKLESADELLARIQREREARYEAQVAEWKEDVKRWEAEGRVGRKPGKPREPKSYSKLEADTMSTLPALPQSWCWDKLGWVTTGVEYGTSSKSSKSGTHPVIRMGNIQNGKIDWEDLVFTSDPEEVRDYLLAEGDVLFNRTNSPELVGKSAVYLGERPAIFAGYLIRLNHLPSVADSHYLNHFLNSHIAKKHGNSVKTDGVNQSNINGNKLSNYPFPYCGLPEQEELVRLLEAAVSSIDNTNKEIDGNIFRAEALRQSILKKAFSGQLVPQDPDDEPAGVLLERIAAEKATRAVGKTKVRGARAK